MGQKGSIQVTRGAAFVGVAGLDRDAGGPSRDKSMEWLRARRDAERRHPSSKARKQARRRILEAAGIDFESLSSEGQHVLDWLAQSDPPTVEAVIETLTAVRLAVHTDLEEPGAPGV